MTTTHRLDRVPTAIRVALVVAPTLVVGAVSAGVPFATALGGGTVGVLLAVTAATLGV